MARGLSAQDSGPWAYSGRLGRVFAPAAAVGAVGPRHQAARLSAPGQTAAREGAVNVLPARVLLPARARNIRWCRDSRVQPRDRLGTRRSVPPDPAAGPGALWSTHPVQ